MTQTSRSFDPVVQIALDLWIRSTPKRDGISRELLETDYTEDIEQVNGFGVYSRGREAVFTAAQKAVGASKTIGLDTKVVSTSLLAPNVILAHLLSSAEVPQGPHAAAASRVGATIARTVECSASTAEYARRHQGQRLLRLTARCA